MLRTLGLAVAVVLILSLCGCYGGHDTVVPDAYVRTWMFVVYDAEGGLMGGGFTEVQRNGSAVATTANGMVFTGTCDMNGVIHVTTTSNSNAYTADGTLTATDTGSGTWTRATNPEATTGHGTFQAYGANGASFAGTWGITVTGPPNGTGTAVADANGVVTGTTQVTGYDNATLSGVVTNAGQLAMMWGTGTPTSPLVVALGTASGSNANGTWSTTGGAATGTWTGVKAP